MSKISIAVRIIDALEKNKNDNGDFLSHYEIAVEIWSKPIFKERSREGRDIAKRLIAMVKRNMGHARALAAENGITIISKRLPTQKNPSIKYRIDGFKIATRSDELSIREELMFKLQRSNQNLRSLNNMAESAYEKKIMPNLNFKALPKPTPSLFSNKHDN